MVSHFLRTLGKHSSPPNPCTAMHLLYSHNMLNGQHNYQLRSWMFLIYNLLTQHRNMDPLSKSNTRAMKQAGKKCTVSGSRIWASHGKPNQRTIGKVFSSIISMLSHSQRSQSITDRPKPELFLLKYLYIHCFAGFQY